MKSLKQPVRYVTLGLIMGIIIGLSSYAVSDVSKVAASPIVLKQEQQQDNNTLPLKEVQRFTSALSQIKSYYVEPISDEVLFQNAIRGMLDGLDPHSGYLDEADFQELTSVTQGEFGGLGLEVTMEEGLIKVVSPIDDTPAFHAGIKAGDLIIRLDDTPIQGMTLKHAIEKMRGKKGTIVNLIVIRQGEKKPLSFNIVRDVIHVQSVKSKMLEQGYGYIRLSQFQLPSAANLSDAIQALNKQANGQLIGLILDLRNNPGGLLDSAIEVSDMFLDSDKLNNNKLIVYTEGRVPGAHFSANATPGDLLKGAPIVILINQGSASAAEIVAGALQDHKRAIIVGENSFGKGSVQTVLPLDENTGIKLTTALYYTPLGRSIQALGIKPDIKVDELEVAKSKNEKLETIYEVNLTGHLNNTSNSAPEDTVGTVDTNNQLLAHDDYQLYEALNILKSIVVAKKLQ